MHFSKSLVFIYSLCHYSFAILGVLYGPTTVFCGPDGSWQEPAEVPFCYGGSRKDIDWEAIRIEVSPVAIAENSPLQTVVGNMKLIIPENYGELSLQNVQYSSLTAGVPFKIDDSSSLVMLKLNGEGVHTTFFNAIMHKDHF